MASSSATATAEMVIDLTTADDAHYVDAYRPERVISWLRSSGGSLGERAMKCAAADLLEQRVAIS